MVRVMSDIVIKRPKHVPVMVLPSAYEVEVNVIHSAAKLRQWYWEGKISFNEFTRLLVHAVE